MLKRNIFFIICLIFGICGGTACSDKESPISEKKFTVMEMSAYTEDTYRFRINLDNDVVTDSLLTPEGKVTKTILFDDYQQRIRVYNTSGNVLLIDTPYTLKLARSNVFTIYQTQADAPPFYLAPPPGEPLAGPNFTKLSIIYTGDYFPDSVKVLIDNQGNTPALTDSFMLKKDTFSKYFEVNANRNSTVRFYNVNNRATQLVQRQFIPTNLNPDFAIYRLTRATPSGATMLGQKLY